MKMYHITSDRVLVYNYVLHNVHKAAPGDITQNFTVPMARLVCFQYSGTCTSQYRASIVKQHVVLLNWNTTLPPGVVEKMVPPGVLQKLEGSSLGSLITTRRSGMLRLSLL